MDAGPLDDAEVALGMQLVATHKCQTCHGDALSGNYDGVLSSTALGGRAYPPNLTPDPGTGLGCWTGAQIENAILNGIDNQGMLLCAPMPRWEHIGDGGLDPAQAQAVVQYLQSLPASSNQIPDTPDCPIPNADAGSDGGVDGSLGVESGAGDAATDAGSG